MLSYRLRKGPDPRILRERLFYDIEQTTDGLIIELYELFRDLMWGMLPSASLTWTEIRVLIRLSHICGIMNIEGRTLLSNI